MDEETKEKFLRFLKTSYKQEFKEAINKGAESFQINFLKLDAYDPELTDKLLEDPEGIIDELNNIVKKELNDDELIRLRFYNLPESTRIRIKDIRTKHLHKFVCIEGLVRITSDVRPVSSAIIFECPACAALIEEKQDESSIKEPTQCPGCGRKGKLKIGSKKLFDTQRLEVEEPPELMEGAEQPKRLNVFLQNDLVDPTMVKKACPGSRVRINGVIKEIPIYLRTGAKSTRFDLIMMANNVETVEQEYEDIQISEEDIKQIKQLANDPKVYEKLISSIAPSIYGHEIIKEAIVLQLFGGVRKERSDKTNVRGDMHLLLVGDPGVAKSQMLKYVSALAPKARYVSGKGSSAAGLCVTPDTLITLPNGGIKTIKEVVEEHITKEGKLINKDADFEIIGFDDKSLKIKPLKVTRVWKIESPDKLLRIRTRTGKEVKVTLDNPMPIIKEGSVKWIKAKDLKKKDRIASPRNIEVIEKEDFPTIKILNKKAHIINSSNIIKTIIKKCMQNDINIREFTRLAEVNENNLYHNWRYENAKGNPSIGNLVRMMNITNLEPNGFQPEKFELSLYNGRTITFPSEINKDLMYFSGLIAGNGDLQAGVNNTIGIRFHNQNTQLLSNYCKTIENLFNIKTRIEKGRTTNSVRINSRIIGEFLNKLGIPSGKKALNIDISYLISILNKELLANYLKGLYDSDGSAILRKSGSSSVEISMISKNLAIKIQLSLLKFGIISHLRRRPLNNSIIGGEIKGKEKYVITIYGKDNLTKFRENINFGHEQKKEKLEKIIKSIFKRAYNIDNIPNCGSLIKKARLERGISQKELYGRKTNFFEGKRSISREKLSEIINTLSMKGETETLKQIKTLQESDILWDEITSLETINKESDYVYDLTIEGTHSFLANGLIVHNTATVIKDEFLRGWTLEAGALVLANKGICMIDELDKMTPQDRVAMHEAMESQVVTISKANVQATLFAQTSILAAANPKLGRFDPYTPISSQIDIPSTLINRFDVIFPLRDLPDKELDDKISTHMLKSARDPQKIKTELSPEVLRKYLAYAKQNCFPRIDETAMNELKQFYINLRNKNFTGDSEVRPIPISARQLESLIRISEASAKIRLSDHATKADAQRAIKLLKHYLSKVGIDPETGELDIDRIVTGITATQRSRIVIIKEAINDLEEKYREGIPLKELLSEAKVRGVEETISEEIIERMKREGEIFEPRHGFLKRMPR